MTIPKLIGVTDEANFYVINVTIFVALSPPADAGLDGTLSLCVVPDTTKWRSLSLFWQLDELPRIYIAYLFDD